MRLSSTFLVCFLGSFCLLDLSCKDKTEAPRAIAVVPASQAPIVQEGFGLSIQGIEFFF